MVDYTLLSKLGLTPNGTGAYDPFGAGGFDPNRVTEWIKMIQAQRQPGAGTGYGAMQPGPSLGSSTSLGSPTSLGSSTWTNPAMGTKSTLQAEPINIPPPRPTPEMPPAGLTTAATPQPQPLPTNSGSGLPQPIVAPPRPTPEMPPAVEPVQQALAYSGTGNSNPIGTATNLARNIIGTGTGNYQSNSQPVTNGTGMINWGDPDSAPDFFRADAALGTGAYADGGVVTVPTEAQKEAGNYKKDHISFQGLPISIENPKGSIRKGKGWEVRMPYDYGYIKRTEGADGDHVDVCIGPDEKSNAVFVVDQQDCNTGKFDEHKVMLGFNSRDEAIKHYHDGFSDGRGPHRLKNIVRMTMDEFKQWLKKQDTTKPLKSQSIVDKALALTRSK